MTQQPETLHYAVSVVGKDRPGIVAGVAEVFFRLGCNIADSSCTMLAGEFAMILIVSHHQALQQKPPVRGVKAGLRAARHVPGRAYPAY